MEKLICLKTIYLILIIFVKILIRNDFYYNISNYQLIVKSINLRKIINFSKFFFILKDYLNLKNLC